jgi:hypothetical protein
MILRRITSYQQVTNAGKRSLDFIAKEVPCENMRSLGFPKNTPEGNCWGTTLLCCANSEGGRHSVIDAPRIEVPQSF